MNLGVIDVQMRKAVAASGVSEKKLFILKPRVFKNLVLNSFIERFFSHLSMNWSWQLKVKIEWQMMMSNTMKTTY